MKLFSKHTKLLLCLILWAAIAHSQVVVNEFCTANYSDWNPGDNEDWIELYNPTGAAVNIGGYWLSNEIDDPMKWQFPAGTNINANAYLIVLFSGSGEYDPNQFGFLNTSFRVTQTNGEDVVFSNASGTILESYDLATMGALLANHSYGRTTDGGANWGIFTDPTNGEANTGTSYAAYTQRPTFSVEAGHKTGPISVTITAQPGTNIYYTTDGNEPTNASTLYTGPVNINATTSLRAIAYSSDAAVLPGKVETNTYFFGNDQHSIMVVNISGSTLSDGAWGWGTGEFTHIEFFDTDGNFIAEAQGDSNEHGNDSNAYDQRGFDYITRDALGYDNEVQFPVFSSSDRQGYERIIFKAAANDNYPFSGGAHIRDAYVHRLSEIGDLHLDERKVESCIVYINGIYWGVYEAREKVDDRDYAKYYYDQPDGFIDFIKTWGGTWEEYGSQADWIDLVDFITTNDMTDAANYNYVLTQYNHMSLIDYFILNGYIVSTDWLNWNTAWWRGRHPDGDARRWRYALWDNDATFGHYVNYTGVPSTNPDADPCQIDGMGDVGGQGHVPVLNALFDNENFFADYIQRYATLSNSIFSCDRMIEVLDSMINVIEPEMERQCQRWGGSVAGWESSVQTLRDFILARCADEVIGGLEDCYDVTAWTVTVQIDGIGEIEMEGLDLNNSNTPFSGIYFADLPLDIEAVTDGLTCGNFAGWEIVSGTGTIEDPTSDSTTFTFTSDVTLVAHFVEPASGPITIMTDLSEPGAGTILVNGNAQPTYPYNSSQDGGETLTLTATENEWYDFLNWEVNNSVVTPNEEAVTISLNPCFSDTIIAVYDYIEHYTLDINVSLDGGGIVLMNGDTIPEGGASVEFLGGENITFTAVPGDQWSQFSHWEVDGNPITPDNLSPSVILELIANGSITAVFSITPHHTITVKVDPPYAGTVVFDEVYLTGNPYSTDYEMTVELEGNKPLQFKAIPAEFIDFKEWSSENTPAIPNRVKPTVAFTFVSDETIIAHFEEQPHAIYIPNSFSPNNDGINDVFQIQGNAIDPEQYHLLIFNRWGQKVFESTDYQKAWEGDFNGGDYYVDGMSYNYVLKAKSVFELSPREYTGSILMVR
jgi:gliding motility-associated-like protein